MGFLVEDYEALRPYVYHTSPIQNATRIIGLRRLDPTATLLKLGGRADLLRRRRDKDHTLQLDGDPVVIRDQKPLNPANIDFAAGWGLPDLVEYVNRRIFFWPGDAQGFISSGSNHFNRYANEHPVIFRVRLRSLLTANPGVQPQFSAYNSGAARQNQGKRIPRGPNTHVLASRFKGTPGEVREIAFTTSLLLPPDTDVASKSHGPWRRVFDCATD
jgi:hypothetical protein